MAVWSVPQAFGNESYWPRYPTPNEFISQIVVSLNHGSLGIVPWDESPTMPPELLDSASILGHALPTITPFLLAPPSAMTFTAIREPAGIDVGSWTLGTKTLVMGTNFLVRSATVTVGPSGKDASVQEVFNTGASIGAQAGKGFEVQLASLGSVALVFSS